VASAVAAGAVVLAVPAELELPPTDGVHLRTSLEGIDPAYLATLLTDSGSVASIRGRESPSGP